MTGNHVETLYLSIPYVSIAHSALLIYVEKAYAVIVGGRTSMSYYCVALYHLMGLPDSSVSVKMALPPSWGAVGFFFPEFPALERFELSLPPAMKPSLRFIKDKRIGKSDDQIK